MRLRLSLPAAAALVAPPAFAAVERPAAIVADGVPAVPEALAERTRPYMEFSGARPRTPDPAAGGDGRQRSARPGFGGRPEVKAVRANGQSAWHLLAKDEGHGFSKKANQDYQFWTSLMFWQQPLLGEAPAADAQAAPAGRSR